MIRASHRMELEFGQDFVPGKHAKRDRESQPEFPREEMSRDEAQEAERKGLTPAARKAEIQEIHAACDDGQAFKNALEGAGYILAQGQRASAEFGLPLLFQVDPEVWKSDSVQKSPHNHAAPQGADERLPVLHEVLHQKPLSTCSQSDATCFINLCPPRMLTSICSPGSPFLERNACSELDRARAAGGRE